MLCDSGTGNVALVARRVVPSRGVGDGARDQIPATRDLDAGRIDVHGLWFPNAAARGTVRAAAASESVDARLRIVAAAARRNE